MAYVLSRPAGSWVLSVESNLKLFNGAVRRLQAAAPLPAVFLVLAGKGWERDEEEEEE